MTTVESAFAIASIAAVLLLGILAVLGVSAQIRCIDAAREVARLTAAGDQAATSTGRRVAPEGATIVITEADGLVTATVSAKVAVVPGLDVTARAVAAREPDGATEISGSAPERPPS